MFVQSHYLFAGYCMNIIGEVPYQLLLGVLRVNRDGLTSCSEGFFLADFHDQLWCTIITQNYLLLQSNQSPLGSRVGEC